MTSRTYLPIYINRSHASRSDSVVISSMSTKRESCNICRRGVDQNIRFSLTHFSCGMYPAEMQLQMQLLASKTTVLSLYKWQCFILFFVDIALES